MEHKYPATKGEYVYQQIRAAILRGEYAAGIRLRQENLAKRFNTSQMPVREALRMLKAEGLVASRNHCGAVVAEIPLRQKVDMASVRSYLEILAIYEGAPLHTKHSIGKLEELAKRMERTTDGRRYSELNRKLHLALVEPCPNEVLKEGIVSLWERISKNHSGSLFVLRPERMKLASAEHRKVIKAIKEGSAPRVLVAASEHRINTLEAWGGVLPAAEVHRPASDANS